MKLHGDSGGKSGGAILDRRSTDSLMNIPVTTAIRPLVPVPSVTVGGRGHFAGALIAPGRASGQAKKIKTYPPFEVARYIRFQRTTSARTIGTG